MNRIEKLTRTYAFLIIRDISFQSSPFLRSILLFQHVKDPLSSRTCFVLLTMQRYGNFLSPQSFHFLPSDNPSDIQLQFRKTFRNSLFGSHISINKTLTNIYSPHGLTMLWLVRKLPFRELTYYNCIVVVYR